MVEIALDTLGAVFFLEATETTFMTTAVRSYTSSAGFTDDFHRVRDFLVRINQDEITKSGFLWGRWEWMFSQPWYCDTSALSRIGIWEEGGEIVAVVTYEAETGFAWFLTDRGHAFLHQDMLRYALDNMTRNGTIRVLIEDADDDLPRIAAAHGLIPTRDKQPNSALDLTGDLSYRLPDGGPALRTTGREGGLRELGPAVLLLHRVRPAFVRDVVGGPHAGSCEPGETSWHRAADLNLTPGSPQSAARIFVVHGEWVPGSAVAVMCRLGTTVGDRRLPAAAALWSSQAVLRTPGPVPIRTVTVPLLGRWTVDRKRPDPMNGRLTSSVNYRLLVGTLDHGR